MKKPIILICFCLFSLLCGRAQAEGVVLSEDSLHPDHLEPELGLFFLFEGWRYHPGDRAEWVDPAFDDSAWDTLAIQTDPWALPTKVNWTGMGWLRLHLKVHPSLCGRPLALYCLQSGASEIYLDGRMIGCFGKVGDARETEEPHFISYSKTRMIPVQFSEGSDHVIAVRYSNFWALGYQHLDVPAWFGLGISELDYGDERRVSLARDITIYQMLFIAPLAFALLHFFLFLFYPEYKRNLYYAIFALSVSALIFAPFQTGFQTSPIRFLWMHWLFKISLILTTLSGLRFLYHIFLGASPKFFRVLLATGVLMLFFSWYIKLDYVYIFVVALFPEMLRTVFVAIRRRIDGARIVGIGFAVFSLTCTYQVLMELGILKQGLFFPYIDGILALMVSMTIYLSRSLAGTYGDLRDQLVQVKALSDRALEQERRAREQEVARKALAAENALKNQELEEARKRQKILEELEQTNRELRLTQAQLVQSEKMASLGNLVAGIAHEINTPVGAINSMHDTLVRAVDKLKDALEASFPEGYKDNRAVQSTLGVIADANRVITTGAERVMNIVRSLRSFARLDEAEMKEVDLHEGIDTTLTLVHHDLKNRIEVVKDYGDVPPIVCYPSRLNQVFLNLLVNAAQAIQGKGKITISTFVKDDRMHVAIRDTGAGIPEQHLKRIFDPGFTTKGVRVGTGLGLSICYQIVQDHKGEIRVESQVGEGTTLTVVLPMDLTEPATKS